MSVGDVAAWYEEYHPNLPFGSLVPGPCYFCWPELQSGDTVVIRKRLTDETWIREGDVGVVKEVLSEGGGSLFHVKLDSGKEHYFIRAQLRKLRDGEVKPDKVTD